MSLLAIALLIASAFFHALWNLLLKGAGEKYLVTWWAVLVGSILCLPALFFTGLPAGRVWLLLLASVLVEVVYYIILATAYQRADFSLVYPLARGAAPVLIVVWSLIFLREHLSWGGVAGLLIVILGLLVVGASSWLTQRREKPSLHGVLLALTVSFLISVYTTIDGAAVKQTAPFPYGVLIFFLAPVFSSPLTFRRYGWAAMKSAWRTDRLRLVAIGALTVLSYLLALSAYAIAPLSYSGAIREVSMVLGAFAGWKFLGERMGGLRLAGAIVIFAGILLIALFG